MSRPPYPDLAACAADAGGGPHPRPRARHASPLLVPVQYSTVDSTEHYYSTELYSSTKQHSTVQYLVTQVV